jgi:hypothetical protein
MEWLLMLLRLLLGRRRPEDSEPQPVAIRPDGTTVPLPPGSNNLFRSAYLQDWLTLFSPFVACFRGQWLDGFLPDPLKKRASKKCAFRTAFRKQARHRDTE